MAHNYPKYVTLQPGVTSLMTFEEDLGRVEILNMDGTDEIWVRFGGSGDVVPMAEGTYVVPSTIGYLTTDPQTSGPTKIYLRSDTALRVGVRAVEP